VITPLSFFFPFILDTMKAQMTIDECKVLWVVGAAERLATLGMLSPDIPCRLTAKAVDDFIEIDNHRDILFDSDFEVASIFNALAASENAEEVGPDELRDVVDLILQYKNNRTEIVRYALSQQTM
jgi:hypothetical protein